MSAITQGWTPAGLVLVGFFFGVLVTFALVFAVDILIERQRERWRNCPHDLTTREGRALCRCFGRQSAA